jgi:hypothetical protein
MNQDPFFKAAIERKLEAVLIQKRVEVQESEQWSVSRGRLS